MTDTPEPTEPTETDISALFMAPDEPEQEDAADEAELPADEEGDESGNEADDEEETGEDEAEEVDEAEEEPDEAPQTFIVKIDGQEREVTLDDLKADYSGRQSISRRINEAEAQKREAAQVFQALQQSQQQVTALTQKLQSEGMIAPPQPPGPELARKDPMGYSIASAEYHQKLAAYQQQQQQITQVTQQQRAAQQAAMDAHVQEQARIMQERIPELANSETSAKTIAMLQSAGAEYGYSADELGGITDARAIQVLHDAAKYRALKNGKTTVKARPKAPSRTVTPKAKRTEPPQLARARQIKAAKATNDPNAILNVFLDP